MAMTGLEIVWALCLVQAIAWLALWRYAVHVAACVDQNAEASGREADRLEGLRLEVARLRGVIESPARFVVAPADLPDLKAIITVAPDAPEARQ